MAFGALGLTNPSLRMPASSSEFWVRGDWNVKSAFLPLILCLAIGACEDANPPPGPAPPAYRVEVSPEPTLHPTPTPQPSPAHNYDERDGVLYSYVAAISEEDRKSGKAAGDVINFAYLGEENGVHVLVQVRPNGSIASRSTCRKPCRVITRDDGSQVGYNENSIIGAAFADALAGRLQQAQYRPNQVATPAPPAALAEQKPVTPVVWSRHERTIMDQWMAANEACRGGTDPEAVEFACAERDGPLSKELAAQNICYGREEEYGYQSELHRCESNSYRLN